MLRILMCYFEFKILLKNENDIPLINFLKSEKRKKHLRFSRFLSFLIQQN